jgi:hypothetical protein
MRAPAATTDDSRTLAKGKPLAALVSSQHSSNRRCTMGDKSPKNTDKAKKQKKGKKAAAAAKLASKP